MSERPGHVEDKGLLSGRRVCRELMRQIEHDNIIQVVLIRDRSIPLYHVRGESSYQANWYREGGHDYTEFQVRAEELAALLDWLGARQFLPINMEEGVPFYPMKYADLYGPSGLVVRHNDWETGAFARCVMKAGRVIKGEEFEKIWEKDFYGGALTEEKDDV